MILYPTETLYALGVNALDENELEKLYMLKGRDRSKAVTWLVRSVQDIERYAEMNETALAIASAFLPGKLTLVLPVRENVPKSFVATDGTVGFRISSDLVAQKVIAEFMDVHNAPLTCTSANISTMETQSTPAKIFEQFGERKKLMTQVVDDGIRGGRASTIVRVVDDEVMILREGDITKEEIDRTYKWVTQKVGP